MLFALLLCVGCPVLYCAGVGPAIWLVNHNIIDEAPAEMVYYPISWLYENVPFLRPLFDIYTDLWND